MDWKPFKRLDIYAGVLATKATGGWASGYIRTDNVATTAGIRLSF